ncbi:dnaJ homolog subfamily C member 27 isoform X1 [Hydra vulgaris]|uniref:dnaJ homolog subfamily C member 27 isoform X1 n=1 Tax=Hydra vulgaris TaxID=6087 RepID=UPI001F5EA076|nr:dnaJ homolog subfamily C member 27 [Hydra vulgaris]
MESNLENSANYLNVISLGNPETGKSCLIKRFCEKRFVSKYLPTIGVDFGVTEAKFGEPVIKINLFDLSGHPIFYEVRNEFYKDIHAVILVFDITVSESFYCLNKWIEEIKQHTNTEDFNKLILLLCGNKIDKKKRLIEWDQACTWARKNGCFYFETSALTGEGVNEVFQTMFKCSRKILLRNELKDMSDDCCKEQLDAINLLKSSKNSYECLGLTSNASVEDINKAYKRLAKLLHPDKCKLANSTDAFQLLLIAKDTLLNNKNKVVN